MLILGSEESIVPDRFTFSEFALRIMVQNCEAAKPAKPIVCMYTVHCTVYIYQVCSENLGV